MTHFLEIARKRYSCRNYDSRPVEQEKLELILEAGRVAPSAVNFQPWLFYVIRETDELLKFHAAYHREWFRTAPCVIVICGDHVQSWKRKADEKDHSDIDVAITTDHMTLQATELGLATCWVCNFDTDKTRELLGLPDYLEPAVILPVGYPLDEVNPDRHGEKRKPLSEIVSYGMKG
jgi:nitroreductase